MRPTAKETIIFLPLNSSSSKIYENQFRSPLLTQRLIGIDFPGHGESDDAIDPKKTYSFEGYAQVVIEFIEKVGIHDPVTICGCSLGGHVAIEILRLKPQMVAGLFLSGAPPIDLTPEGFSAGFKPFSGLELISKGDKFTESEAQKFVGMVWPECKDYMIRDAMRTDGRARSFMIAQALSGEGVSQRETIENSAVPLAFVIGTRDEGINGEYIKELAYQTSHILHELDCGHDTFFVPHGQFNRWLNEFVHSNNSKKA